MRVIWAGAMHCDKGGVGCSRGTHCIPGCAVGARNLPANVWRVAAGYSTAQCGQQSTTGNWVRVKQQEHCGILVGHKCHVGVRVW